MDGFFSIHKHWTDNGLGKQSYWDPCCRNRALGWSVHAQKSTETQVPLREKWQSKCLIHEQYIFLNEDSHRIEQITGFHTNSCLGCQDCAFGEILLFIPLNRFINQQLGGGGLWLWLLFPIILCKEIFNCVWYMYSSFCHFQVFFSSMRSGSSCQIYFMTLNKPGLANWWRILTAMEIF